MIYTDTDIGAGMETGAALADKDGAGAHNLTVVALYAQPFAVAVASVLTGSLTFFM